MQTIAMGLLIIVLDVPPTGWDWIADPLGWVLVLLGLSAVREEVPNHRGLSLTAWVCLAVSVIIYPPGSVATLDDGLGWVFSVPTVAWCFLMSDALHDVATGGRRVTLLWLRNLFVLVVVLPLLVYLAGVDWLTTPAAVLAVGANVMLIYLLWTTPEEDEEEPGAATSVEGRSQGEGTAKQRPWQTPERVAERERGSQQGRTKRRDARRGSDQQITGAEVVERVRRRRKES